MGGVCLSCAYSSLDAWCGCPGCPCPWEQQSALSLGRERERQADRHGGPACRSCLPACHLLSSAAPLVRACTLNQPRHLHTSQPCVCAVAVSLALAGTTGLLLLALLLQVAGLKAAAASPTTRRQPAGRVTRPAGCPSLTINTTRGCMLGLPSSCAMCSLSGLLSTALCLVRLSYKPLPTTARSPTPKPTGHSTTTAPPQMTLAKGGEVRCPP